MRAIAFCVLAFLVCACAARAGERWIVISDIHLNPYDRASHGRRGSDTNQALWNLTLAQLRNERAPSVVVLDGDLLAHHFDTLAHNNGEDPDTAGLRTMRRMAAELSRVFPHAQFLVALGNNDDPCGDYRSETGGNFQRELAAIFEPLVNRNGAAPQFSRQFEQGGYYEARLPGGRRALVLNSVIWSFVYRGGCNSPGQGAASKELAWLATMLQSPQRSVLVMHIPPGYDPQSTTTAHRILAVPFLSTGNDRALLSEMQAASDRIPFAIAGHTHRYDFRIAGGVPMLVASSISPIYRNQPAFFELDVEPNGDLRDVTPVTYDPWEETWDRETSFDALYGINAFTTPNLQRASQRIANDEDVRRKWIAAYDVWSYRMGDVADHSWRVYWCAQTELANGYAACAGTERRTTGVIAVAIAAAVIVIGVLVLLTRRLTARRS